MRMCVVKMETTKHVLVGVMETLAARLIAVGATHATRVAMKLGLLVVDTVVKTSHNKNERMHVLFLTRSLVLSFFLSFVNALILLVACSLKSVPEMCYKHQPSHELVVLEHMPRKNQ
jgi:flagellar biosynthesis protein FliR